MSLCPLLKKTRVSRKSLNSKILRESVNIESEFYGKGFGMVIVCFLLV